MTQRKLAVRNPIPGVVDVNVEYGAVGNGSNDDTAALERAMTDLNSGVVAGLSFPGKEYITTSTLVIADQRTFRLIGQGQAINYGAARPETMIRKSGTSTTTDAGVLQIVSCQNYTVENLNLKVVGATGAAQAVEVTAGVYAGSANLTGTVTKTAQSATLTGSGTSFTTELVVGQIISVPGTQTESRMVTAIGSNTSCTVNPPFAYSASGQTAAQVAAISSFLGRWDNCLIARNTSTPEFGVAAMYLHNCLLTSWERCSFHQNYVDDGTAVSVRLGATQAVEGASGTSPKLAIGVFSKNRFTRCFFSGDVERCFTLDVTYDHCLMNPRGGGQAFDPVPSVFTTSGDADTRNERLIENDLTWMPSSPDESRTFYTQGTASGAGGLIAQGNSIDYCTVTFDLRAPAGGNVIQGNRFYKSSGSPIPVRIASAVTGPTIVEGNTYPTAVTLPIQDNRSSQPTYSAGAWKDGSIIARRTVANDYARIVGGKAPGSGSIRLYGDTHATQANQVVINSPDFYVQSMDGATNHVRVQGGSVITTPDVYDATTAALPNVNVGSTGMLKRATVSALGTADIGTTVQAYDAELTTAAGMTARQGTVLANYRVPFVAGAGGAAISKANDGITTEQEYTSVLIPGSTMGTAGFVRVTTHWSCTSNTNAKQIFFKLGTATGTGGTTLRSSGTASLNSQTNYFITIGFQNRGAATGQMGGALASSIGSDSGATSASIGTAAINTANDSYVQITGQRGTGTDTLTLERYLVEVWPTA